MDYKVVSEFGADVREKPSSEIGVKVLCTIARGFIIDVGDPIKIGNVTWYHPMKYKGWIRSDLLEKYTPDAKPDLPIQTDKPTDDRYSIGYTAGWNACCAFMAEVVVKAKVV